MALIRRFRDVFKKYTVAWLNDRPGELAGKTVGYRLLWAMIAPLDVFAEYALQAVQAPWPGRGTPSALEEIGRSRGMIRGQGETDDAYAARLLTWLERSRQYGSMLSTARAIHEYLGNRPRVRVYNRAGACLEVAASTGAVTRYAAGSTAWDWDSVSHPGRSGYWWDLWACVYPSQWTDSPVLEAGSRVLGAQPNLGVGCSATRVERDALASLVEQHTSAHSHMRAVIFTSDAALFDPAVPATQPDGQWGAWSTTGSGSRVASHRNVTSCRYLEL